MTVRSSIRPEPVAIPLPARDDAGAPRDEVVRAPSSLTVAARDSVTVASEAGRLELTAATEIVLRVGQSTFTLRADGTILLDGRRMTLSAPGMIALNPESGADAPPTAASDPAGDAAADSDAGAR